MEADQTPAPRTPVSSLGRHPGTNLGCPPAPSLCSRLGSHWEPLVNPLARYHPIVQWTWETGGLVARATTVARPVDGSTAVDSRIGDAVVVSRSTRPRGSAHRRTGDQRTSARSCAAASCGNLPSDRNPGHPNSSGRNYDQSWPRHIDRMAPELLALVLCPLRPHLLTDRSRRGAAGACGRLAPRARKTRSRSRVCGAVCASPRIGTQDGLGTVTLERSQSTEARATCSANTPCDQCQGAPPCSPAGERIGPLGFVVDATIAGDSETCRLTPPDVAGSTGQSRGSCGTRHLRRPPSGLRMAGSANNLVCRQWYRSRNYRRLPRPSSHSCRATSHQRVFAP